MNNEKRFLEGMSKETCPSKFYFTLRGINKNKINLMLKSAVLIEFHGHILCCKFSPLKKKNCCHYPELEIRIADFLLLPAMNLSDRNAIVSEIILESAFVVWLATDRRRLRKANVSERGASPWSLYRSPFSWVIYCRFISDPV